MSIIIVHTTMYEHVHHSNHEQIAGLNLTIKVHVHGCLLSCPTLKSTCMNLLHREANDNMLNGLWELLLHAIKSKDLFAESKHSITIKPQLIQVCR